ncbi:MAG: cyclic nucleotide-binding domain-containing protein [bacterium]|nr:cyclic nucleotide-binding domain-containing protein [bacterium]
MLDELLSLRAQSEFLASLAEPELRDLAEELDEVRCTAEETLMRAGDAGDRLYVVLRGRLAVLVAREGGEDQVVGEVGPGEVTGEVSLFIGGKRTATVRALTACHLASLSRDGFTNLLEKYPETSRRVSELVLSRLRLSHLAPQLYRIFGPLDLEVLRELEAEIEWLTLKSGQDLFRQGEPADAAYIVVSGRLRAAVETPRGEQVLAEMGPGEMVGEMALLTGGSRSATVYAVRDAGLARLQSQGLERLIDRYPRAMLPISRIIVDRLVRQNSPESFPKGDAKTISLVPANDGVPLADVARGLMRSLADHGSALLLTSANVDEALAKTRIAQIEAPDAHHIRLAQWLNDREATFRFVVYQADPHWTPWTDRCVRHADHLVIVADAESDPTPGEMEKPLAGYWPRVRAPRRSLVLLQRGLEPTGTSRWLAAREIEEHYHVRSGSEADFARLARSLSGNAVGLVLGGGGARGFAHLGVIKALEELSIPIDRVGGTSMGAIIAGLYAQGLDSAEIQRRCAQYAGAQLDFTFPAVALLAGKKIGGQFRALFGQRHIEDLWIPFFAVSTNLTRAEQVVHGSGRLASALRASMSLPGILPPARQGSDLLVDGGLINNVPADVMRERGGGGGSVIAVDVSQAVDLRGDTRLTTELSGWKMLRNRLNPFSETIPAPGILSLLNRAAVVGSIAALKWKKSQADLYLDLPLNEWKTLEFEAIEEIATRGYELAIEPIRAWCRSARATQT